MRINKLIIFTALIAFSALVSGCAAVGFGDNMSINIGAKTGNGKMLDSEVVLTEEFDSIDTAYMNAKIVLSNKKNQTVTYTIDEDLKDDLSFEVKDRVLHIGTKNGINIQSKEKIVFNVGIEKIKGINVAGGVEIVSTETLTTDDFRIDVSGAAKTDLDIECTSIVIDCSGAAKMTVRGKADTISIDLSGASEVYAKELIAKNANVDFSGASKVEVYASETLTGEGSGAGKVTYYGDPRTDFESSGAVSFKRGE